MCRIVSYVHTTESGLTMGKNLLLAVPPTPEIDACGARLSMSSERSFPVTGDLRCPGLSGVQGWCRVTDSDG
jgi:hypothetical protein